MIHLLGIKWLLALVLVFAYIVNKLDFGNEDRG